MLRSMVILLSVLLLAGCGDSDLSDPTKPRPRLLTSGPAAAGSTAPATGTTPAAAPATAATEEPSQPAEDFAREFFRTYLDTFEDKSWFGDADLMAPWFTQDLARLALANHAACQKNHDGCIEFDPIIDAQDYDDEIYATLHTERLGAGEPVRVKVTFENLGSTTSMTYTLVLVDGGWRISDIDSSNYGSLSVLVSKGSPAI